MELSVISFQNIYLHTIPQVWSHVKLKLLDTVRFTRAKFGEQENITFEIMYLRMFSKIIYGNPNRDFIDGFIDGSPIIPFQMIWLYIFSRV